MFIVYHFGLSVAPLDCVGYCHQMSFSHTLWHTPLLWTLLNISLITLKN